MVLAGRARYTAACGIGPLALIKMFVSSLECTNSIGISATYRSMAGVLLKSHGHDRGVGASRLQVRLTDGGERLRKQT